MMKGQRLTSSGTHRTQLELWVALQAGLARAQWVGSLRGHSGWDTALVSKVSGPGPFLGLQALPQLNAMPDSASLLPIFLSFMFQKH